MRGRYEKFENDRWSDFAPFLSILPPLSKYEHIVLMPREDVLLLYGSSVYEEVLAFNATLHADYALCSRLIRVNPALRKAFKNAFSYSHFIVCVLDRFDV